MATSPLVPDIAPLLAGLQQFTPQAREDRAFQLAGLESQQSLRDEQLVAAQATNRRNQIIDSANANRVELLEDTGDLDFVLKGGVDGLANSIAKLVGKKGENHPDIPELIEFHNQTISDPQATFDLLTKNRAQLGSMLTQVDRILTKPGSTTAGSEQRFFESLTTGLSPKEAGSARRIKLRLEPGAVGSSVQTISEKGTAIAIAETEETLAGGRETGKLKAQKRFKPLIAAAVKRASARAAEEGEVFTDLARSEAALPGLLESVSQLKELALIATSTLGGRVFDAAVKETGFGSTKGANAKAKFIAIVNNQVLPLLKPTFGAAFTVQEGESLKATMGDPDATPEQKILQLEAFIDQKVRNIQSAQRQIGEEVAPASELTAPLQTPKFLGFE